MKTTNSRPLPHCTDCCWYIYVGLVFLSPKAQWEWRQHKPDDQTGNHVKHTLTVVENVRLDTVHFLWSAMWRPGGAGHRARRHSTAAPSWKLMRALAPLSHHKDGCLHLLTYINWHDAGQTFASALLQPDEVFDSASPVGKMWKSALLDAHSVNKKYYLMCASVDKTQ